MIEIKNDFIQFGVLPTLGGSLAYLKYKEIDILRPTKPDETETNQTALFPMIPYASFIQDGHFPYLGITRKVEKNSPISKNPMHGDVWRSPLQVETQNEHSIKLTYQHNKNKGYPFSYTAKVEYKLKDDSFEIIETLENDSVLPMPFGMGIHPFFVKDPDTQISFNAPKIWYRGDDPILGHPYTAPKNFDFKEAKSVPANGCNMSFGSWDSKAFIDYPSKNIHIDILADNSFRHLVLFSPKGKNFFCLEPVTNTPDAFNLASLGIVGTGIQSLGPQQTLSGKIKFIMKGLK